MEIEAAPFLLDAIEDVVVAFLEDRGRSHTLMIFPPPEPGERSGATA